MTKSRKVAKIAEDMLLKALYSRNFGKQAARGLHARIEMVKGEGTDYWCAREQL